MATLYVTEWTGIREQFGGIQAPYGFIKTNNLTIGAEAHTPVVSPQCNLVEISNDAICSYLVTKDAVATAANMRLPADSSRFICVNAGVDRVSAITNT